MTFVPDRFSVEGSVVVITGALGQLGRAYSGAFASSGARVVALDVAPIAEGTGQIQAVAPTAAYWRVDITDKSALQAVLANVEESVGRPTVLINNAALDSPPDSNAADNGPFEEYPEDTFDKVMNVNVKGSFLCCQIFGASMAAGGGGSIINVGSIYGLVSPNHSVYEFRHRRGEAFYKPVAYSASKSALYNLTRYLATYWAKKAVRVNSVTLAGVFNQQEEAFLNSYLPHVPMGRMAEPEDYVGPMLFLASSASRYMTGANLVVDGGWTAW